MIDPVISVFGSTGFVGSWFCSRTPEKFITQERDDLSPATNNILWLISTTNNYNVFDDPHIDIDTNLTRLMHMLTEARDKFGNNFCVNFISTWFVYGLGAENPATETAHCNPSGFYSVTKYAAELLLKSYCETFGVKYRILRLANMLGVGDNNLSYKNKATQFMVKELMRGHSVKLYKDVSLRDYMDVRDAVHAIELVITSGELNTVYNIGNGFPVSVNELVYKAQEICGSGSIYEVEVPEFHKTVQTREFWMDTRKLKLLGYSPKYTLEDTLNWMIKNG
jgi:nucleoside-diphosphate-sugar epimerase